VLLPFLLFTPVEKALLIALVVSLTVLFICGYAKARYYKVPAAMEIVRTALLPVVAIGILYGIIQFFS
jgi:VIT1/CCC1 family predicted Fe2+/Mn2+ transporter